MNKDSSQSQNNLPFCSVIVLNYNGENIITQTLQSLEQLKYPKDKYEIIVVDNHSKDKSQAVIREFSSHSKAKIRTLYLKKNRGFAGGNNQGILISKGQYIALLNNDCLVDQNWLGNLVATSKQYPKSFAIGSKTLLYAKYFNLSLEVPSDYVLSTNYQIQSAILALTSKGKAELNVKYFKPGLYEYEFFCDPQKDKTIQAELSFWYEGHEKSEKTFSPLLKYPDGSYAKIIHQHSQKRKRFFTFEIDPNKAKPLKDKIQNAGIIMFQNGYGRDIGALVRYQTQNYEYDMGQYQQTKEIYAACGVACLYDKAVLDKIGLLNESFFMYYEDVEIAERARLHGFESIYCPQAIVRHMHALSSSEWSAFFIYHAERGRLLHMIYHFPLSVFLKTWIRFSAEAMARLLSKTKDLKSLQINWQYLKIAVLIKLNLPIYLWQRHNLHRGISAQSVQKQYNKIKTGSLFIP